MSWKKVCKYIGVSELDFSEFVEDADSVSTSPIDLFLERCRELIILHGSEYDEENTRDIISQLVIAAAVGACEELVRDILDLVTSHCPVSRSHLKSNEIKISLIDKYGENGLARAFTSHVSLTSAKNINNTCNRLCGLNLKNCYELQSKLAEFEKVSNLRHAAIHAQGTLGHGNLSTLLPGDTSVSVPSQIVTSVGNVHAIINFAQDFGRSFNRSIYVLIVERLIAESAFTGAWDSDKEFVVPLIEGFYSINDMEEDINIRNMYMKIIDVFN